MFATALQLDPAVLICFVLTAGCVLILAFTARPRVTATNQRLESLGADFSGAPALPQSANLLGLQGGTRSAIGRRGKAVQSSGGLSERMVQAGLYSPGTQSMFYVVRAVGFFLPVVAGYTVARAGMMTTQHGLLLGLFFGMAGTLVPGILLDHLKKQRQIKLRRALPDALDVISVCLQGGLSLGVALNHVARELNMAHPALASELNIIGRQIEMGRSTSDSIREMANRFDLDELRSMASVIGQAERIGASVAAALEIFAEGMRLKRHQRAEELAHKAAVTMLIPTLFFVFPAVFVVILGPAMLRIYLEVLPGMTNH